MTLGAKSRGTLGVVVAGRCRDISEHREASFPVFAKGQSTLGQKPFTRPSALNIPLTISSGDTSGWPEVDVNPEDWIVADQDGVVCIPREMLTRVCEMAEKGRREDQKCREDIIAGKGVQASFDKWRGKL
jgi:regulator of RNase E activity RraA